MSCKNRAGFTLKEEICLRIPAIFRRSAVTNTHVSDRMVHFGWELFRRPHGHDDEETQV